MSESASENLIYIFPEQFSKDCLLKKLHEFGLDENASEKIKDDLHSVVRCFYVNLASLPRRLPRSNRRGKILKKLHLKEDRSSTIKHSDIKTLTTSSSVQSIVSVNGYSQHKPTPFKSSTSEMDRLEARSRAAQKAKLKQKDKREPVCKTLKLSNNRVNEKKQSNASSSTSLTNNKSNALITSVAPVEPKQSQAELKSGPGLESQACKRKTLDNITDTVKVPRKKLKRNSFAPSNQQSCVS